MRENRANDILQLLDREHIDTVPLLFENLNLLKGVLPIATHSTLVNYRQSIADSLAVPQQPARLIHAHTPDARARARSATRPLPLTRDLPVETSPQIVTEWWLARNEHASQEDSDPELCTDPPASHNSRGGRSPTGLQVHETELTHQALSYGEWEKNMGTSTPGARSWHEARAHAREESKKAEEKLAEEKLEGNLAAEGPASAWHYQSRGATEPSQHQIIMPKETHMSGGEHSMKRRISNAMSAQLAAMQEAAREESKIVSEPLELGLVWLTQFGFTASTLNTTL